MKSSLIGFSIGLSLLVLYVGVFVIVEINPSRVTGEMALTEMALRSGCSHDKEKRNN